MVQADKFLTVDVSTPATMDRSRWTGEQLDAARHRADPEVDHLVTQVLAAAGDGAALRGRAAYNHLLELADKLVEAPESVMLRSSGVMKQLQWYPDDMVAYFEPTPLPDWVDTEQLRRASVLWEENLLAIMVVLYAASLPACYLMHRGIPALYASTKLKDSRYISQRIYETGLFLGDVLAPDGLKVMTDIEDISQEDVRQGVRLRDSNQRYLWGKGYVAAKKVRFLHAAMRFMLTQPPEEAEAHRHQALEPWDEAAYGKPVNQEDLAFTLLTFGYLIPRGLTKWGCPWKPEEKESFWHLWRVVGFVMGIDDALLPGSAVEAEQLYLMILERESGPSDQGQALTTSLMQFFQSYLPPGLSTMIPPMLIAYQLGDPYAAMALPAPQWQQTQRFATRLIFYTPLALVRLYYFVRTLIFRCSPALAEFMSGVFVQAGNALVLSWRDAYVRRPFDVPRDATDWRPMAGVDEADMAKLQKWRNGLFIAIALGLCLLILSSASLCLSALLWLLNAVSQAKTTAWLTAGGFVAAIGILKVAVPQISRQRPKLTT